MRKIITTTFVTMDGVMQAPGGPEEDPSGAFPYGGDPNNAIAKSFNDAMKYVVSPDANRRVPVRV